MTLTFDLLTLKVVSESRVTWAISANFGPPRPLCSRFRPDVRDRRQTEASLNAPAYQGRGIIVGVHLGVYMPTGLPEQTAETASIKR